MPAQLRHPNSVQRLPPRTAMRIARDAARALAAAHSPGVVHRDVKPQNILPAGVTDFGMAREERSDLTATGTAIGTPLYGSPEQLEGHDALIDPRSDLYRLGATLYHMLTGRPPFQADSPLELVRRVEQDEPVPLRRLVAGLSPEIQTIVLTCIEKHPVRRCAGAVALADGIERFLRGEVIRARPAGALRRLSRWTARNRNLVAASGVSLTAGLPGAVLLTVVAAWREADEDTRTLASAGRWPWRRATWTATGARSCWSPEATGPSARGPSFSWRPQARNSIR